MPNPGQPFSGPEAPPLVYERGQKLQTAKHSVGRYLEGGMTASF